MNTQTHPKAIKTPPLASCLLVELHRVAQADSASTDPFYVRFLYRNSTSTESPEPIPLWPPSCGPAFVARKQQYLCPLRSLESAIRGTYVLQTQANQCVEKTRNESFYTLIQPECTVSVSMFGIVLLQFFLLLCLFFRMRRNACKLRAVHVLP
ncbi:unnamed protein product [Echinostoma caproni]|uniref:DUF3707 domain-containing protein n=1 Tax=Echinostoma caproni TaxID=27848 RepID=A0A183B3Q2_9TREM|nr:unnamed protein product [Echinostoma caproni]